MSRTIGILAVDAPLIAATLFAAIWMGTHTDLEVESALGLESTKWLHDMDAGNQARQMGRPAPLGPRERFAKEYPTSPIARINANPSVAAVEKGLESGFERILPGLAIVSVGLGIVAIRRPGPRSGRLRSGPGRVAAGVALAVSSFSLAIEIALRKFDLMKYGWYHDTMDQSWLLNGRTTSIAILSAWFLMAAAGRWRVARGWREWLGLGIGLAWMVFLAWFVVLVPLSQL